MSKIDYSSQLRAIEAQNTATISQYFGKTSNTTKSTGLMGSTSILPSTSSSPFSGVISGLSDYGLIHSGSYGKLVKAYYEKNSDTASETEQARTSKGLASSRDTASNLKDAANALTKANYDKVKTTDSDGKEVVDYDKNNLYKLASDFVKSYNTALDSAADVDNTSVLSRALSMTNRTKASENLLRDVGITIGDDNKLSIDEDKFKKADMSAMKVLFKGNNSYASRIASDASAINNLSSNALSTTSGRAYTPTGSYTDVSTSSLYDSLT